MDMPPLHSLPDALRRRIVGEVRGLFNDRGAGERPVERSAHAIFPAGSVIWRVHGDVATMTIGGIAALMMQMLHPRALAGVWDHSRFREDMIGRLRRTARFIAITTYGAASDAEAAIAKVRQVHGYIEGTMADGTPYAASDPALLAWVHVCEATAFLDAWIAFAEPGMSRADQDRYFAEAAAVARGLGADPVPESRAQAQALLRDFQPQLAVTPRTREVARLILRPPATTLALLPAQRLISRAAVDILPSWAREMHGLGASPLGGAVVKAGAFTLAQTVRWAFGQKLRAPV
ncbi:MAG: oxygenase MpaB family protein [Sphingobium sp.]